MGAWGDSLTAPPWWIFSPGDGPEYHVALRSDSTVVDSAFVGRLVRLRGVLLLDLYRGPLDPDSSMLACIGPQFALTMSVPMHAIFRVECTGSNLEIGYLDDEWFDDYIKKFPRSVHYVKTDGGPMLTGPTDEVRAFLSRHLDDPHLFLDFKPLVRCASAPAVPAED